METEDRELEGRLKRAMGGSTPTLSQDFRLHLRTKLQPGGLGREQRVTSVMRAYWILAAIIALGTLTTSLAAGVSSILLTIAVVGCLGMRTAIQLVMWTSGQWSVE